MKLTNIKVLVLLTAYIITSCDSNMELNRAGVCLSFDDQSVTEWFELRELFKSNNVIVTFFISEPKLLDSTEIAKLKLLQEDGHEIGFHGNLHVLSEYYIKEHSYASYLKDEIEDGLILMDSIGFNCRSFAYPYGSKYWFTDVLLLRKFDHLRSVSGVNNEKDLTIIDDIYYSFDGDKTISAIGFDNNERLNDMMINDAMEKALEKKNVLMLYGHTPTNNSTSTGYYFSEDRLKYIIDRSNQLGLAFYRIKDLN